MWLKQWRLPTTRTCFLRLGRHVHLMRMSHVLKHNQKVPGTGPGNFVHCDGRETGVSDCTSTKTPKALVRDHQPTVSHSQNTARTVRTQSEYRWNSQNTVSTQSEHRQNSWNTGRIVGTQAEHSRNSQNTGETVRTQSEDSRNSHRSRCRQELLRLQHLEDTSRY